MIDKELKILILITIASLCASVFMPKWMFVLVLKMLAISLPISLIGYGVYSIKMKFSTITGRGNFLRGRSGAITRAVMDSKGVYGESAEVAGFMYLLSGFAILILYLLGWFTIRGLK